MKSVTVLISAMASNSLLAYNESLSFTISPTGNIQAVVSGRSDGPGCLPEFLSPTSIVVSGNTISITSNYPSTICTLPMTPTPYSVAADLGPLTGGPYQVTWTEGPLVLTGTLVPDALVPISIPTLSPPLIVLLSICMVLSLRLFKRPRA